MRAIAQRIMTYDSYLRVYRGSFECHFIILYLMLFLQEHTGGLYDNIHTYIHIKPLIPLNCLRFKTVLAYTAI